MNVKKIFIILITIVACVILGAFVLNTLMPNTVTTMINSTEDMIFKATSMKFDLNGDGTAGSGGDKTYTGTQDDEKVEQGGNVEGFN